MRAAVLGSHGCVRRPPPHLKKQPSSGEGDGRSKGKQKREGAKAKALLPCKCLRFGAAGQPRAALGSMMMSLPTFEYTIVRVR